ncbi:urease-associated protein [Leptospira hartskeerlii]|uniref:Urease-associated protein n=1 Tax=Leptospira hartskeerlii TaxID=2023177 RepID=A0A2M9X9N8_9LEPT|nr:lysozyme inhibitor LprI family protein [Leptospira hartskeerlii]PJZ24411.1 urease-associated protein [Leptospira hartskeerlii]PJZ32977.1 urease-associated protein [Leptospira hartskeerlii]
MHCRTFFASLLLFTFSIFPKTPESSDVCSKIKIKNDQKKCYSKEYQVADKELNVTYKKIREDLSESQKEDLKKLQVLWIGYRDGICEGPMYASDESGLETIICKTETTAERTKYLNHVWKFGKASKEGLGSYTDGFGGTLKLFRNKSSKSIQFSFDVVRGPTAHLGEVSGNWNPAKEGKWTWASTEGCKPEDPDCCLLEFEYFQNRIEVEEVSCSAYHGARAYFGGSYRYKFK